MILGGKCLFVDFRIVSSSFRDKQFKRAIRAKYFQLCGLNMVSELGGKTYPYIVLSWSCLSKINLQECALDKKFWVYILHFGLQT